MKMIFAWNFAFHATFNPSGTNDEFMKIYEKVMKIIENK